MNRNLPLSVLLVTVVLFTALFVSCSGKVSAQTVADGTQGSRPENMMNDPEIIRLQKALSSLSQRAKAAIPNGDPEEFLTDLKKALASRSSDMFLLCDKTHPLPEGYEPADLVHLVSNESYTVGRNNLFLRVQAEKQLRSMGSAAGKEGITLLVSSSYRSYAYQKEVYDRWVRIDGQKAADRESARAGTSQHQTGNAVDFGSIDDSYAQTAAGKWLAANAEKFGWSLSFPQGYEDVTGYRWECWHYRYLGIEACRFQKKWFGDIQQFMLEFIDAWNKV